MYVARLFLWNENGGEKMKKILYFDTETTGLDPKVNDIIQLSGFVEKDGKIIEKFNLKCRPRSEKTVNQQALDIQGRTLKEVMEWPERDKVFSQFVDILKRHINQYNKADKFYTAGYNVAFDMDFLSNFFKEFDNPYMGSFFNYRKIDPLSILHYWDYMGVISLENYKLSTVCDYFGVELKAHDAMADIIATKILINTLTGIMREIEVLK